MSYIITACNWIRIILSITCINYFSVFAKAQCVVPNSSISFSNIGQNSNMGFTTQYVLTDGAGGILQTGLTSPLMTPISGGNYFIYAINYSGTVNGLAVGNNMSGVSGSCISTSSTNFCVSNPCIEKGTSITFNNNGQTASKNYITKYVLVNMEDRRVMQDVSSPFTTPLSNGDYAVFAVNYDSSKGTAPTLAAGTPIASIGGSCTAVSSNPMLFSVCNTLPVTLLHFAVKKEGKKALLSWRTSFEQGSCHHVIERSDNTRTNYMAIGKLAAKKENGTEQEYSWIDPVPLQGMNYYRLKMVDCDGRSEYSSIRKLDLGTFGTVPALSPNPTTQFVRITGVGPGMQIAITNMVGQLISNHTARETSINISLENWPKGTYTIHVIDNKNGGKVYSLKLVKN